MTDDNSTKPPLPPELPPVSPEVVDGLLALLDPDINTKAALEITLAWNAKHPGTGIAQSQGQADKRLDYYRTLDKEQQQKFSELAREIAQLICVSLSRFMRPNEPDEQQQSEIWVPSKGDPGLIDSQGLKEPPA